MVGITKSAVERFLQQYASAAERLDAEATAALWGETGTILTDEYCGPLATRTELGDALAQGYPAYARFGMSRVDFTVLDWTQLTERIVRVHVRWHYFDAREQPLVDTDYEYVLRDDGDEGLRAYVAIGIDEAERLAELRSRVAAD